MKTIKLMSEKFEITFQLSYPNGIRTFSTTSQITVFQSFNIKIQFKSCTKEFNDNPCKFT